MTPRELALRLLLRAETNDQFLNISLDHALSESGMSDADRALTATLVYGVTERRLLLDYQIRALSSRPDGELDPKVRNALRLGLYQLICLDRIPPHAAINESVSLVPRKASGFVNAILRAYTRDPGLRLPDPDKDPVEYLSVRYSVCPPLCRRLLTDLGRQETEAFLASLETVPPTTLAVNTLRISREDLASHIEGSTPTLYSPGGLRVKGAVRALYGFEEGLFFVQDEASQICVAALDAQPGETVIDVCSCPGSKSFGAAISMQNRGRVLSYDLHQKKLPLIESGAKRLGITIITAAARDGRDPIPELFESADCVLCDVPCSGFGVLAKKPELRYKDPKTSEALPRIQRDILENACRYLRVGGILVYSTCTVLPEENGQNVKAFLEAHPEFAPVPFSVGELSAESGMITLMPHRHGTDGFFVAKLRRIR